MCKAIGKEVDANADVDLVLEAEEIIQESDEAINPIIKESIRSNSELNVFLMDHGVRRSFSIGKTSVDNDVLCIKPQNSQIILRLEGAGDHAKIARWT